MKTVLMVILFLLFSCGSRKVNNQKIQETAKTEINEVKKENKQEIELSVKEIITTILDLDTSNLTELEINYKGKKGDLIEFIKEPEKLIIKGSGELSIKSKKENTQKNKVSNQTLVENTVKKLVTSFNSKKNSTQKTKIVKQDKQTKNNNYSIFYFIGFLLLTAAVIYLLKRFKLF